MQALIKVKHMSITKITIVKICFFGILFGTTVKGQSFIENFDSIDQVNENGWIMKNNSSIKGDTNWFNGETHVFSSQNGPANSYIATNYNTVNSFSSNTISNWLLSPSITINNGDTFSFFTRKNNNSIHPDRLEIRLSEMNESTNIGNYIAETGDFKKILLTINPNLSTTGYPTSWQKYTVTIEGLTKTIKGRIGFRYFAENAGIEAKNGDYIGIDSFEYKAISLHNNELSTKNSKTVIYPIPTNDILNIQSTFNIQSVHIYSLQGQKILSQNNIFENKIDVSNIPSGIYILQIISKEKTEHIKFIKK